MPPRHRRDHPDQRMSDVSVGKTPLCRQLADRFLERSMSVVMAKPVIRAHGTPARWSGTAHRSHGMLVSNKIRQDRA